MKKTPERYIIISVKNTKKTKVLGECTDFLTQKDNCGL